jgi:hypothetical protein
MHTLASLATSTRAFHALRTVEPAAASTPAESGVAPPTTTADAPATTQHLSGSGRLLGFLQAIHDRHPEEADRVLNGIAEKLRADAERGGPWSERLSAWADKFELAAESNDLSNLLPSYRPFGHFGIRAYRENAGLPDVNDLDAVVSGVGVATPTRVDSAAAATPSAVVPETLPSIAPPVVTRPVVSPAVPDPVASSAPPIATAPSTTPPATIASGARVEIAGSAVPSPSSPIDPSVVRLTVEPDPSLPLPDAASLWLGPSAAPG